MLAALAIMMVALAWMRPIDHDESQYVAAAVLSAHGLLPYRDYAYLQTPLQPLLFAPIAWAAGDWAYPALRIVNALLGAAAVAGVYAAARVAGALTTIALAAAGLFAACDILLFSAGTARNDALPAAMLALSLPLMLKAERGDGSRAGAAIIGLLLAGAAAAKISYAVPALAYGIYALARWRHRPLWLVAGTLPAVVLVGWTVAASPSGFLFGTLVFPSAAPAEYYRAADKAWKLGQAAKLLDTLKFLALGPALVSLGIVAMARRQRWPSLLDWLILAGLVSALLPTPTWRQYLLPVLPPLFVRLAQLWEGRSLGRWRIVLAVFAAAGLAPSVAAVATGGGLIAAGREGGAIRRALDSAGVIGGVATLSPEFLPATGRQVDPRFATGPFYFRSHGLLPATDESRLHLIARDRLPEAFASEPPAAILVGGEGRWTSGDDVLDRVLEDWAVRHGWRGVTVESRHFRLYLPPQAAARRFPSSSSE
ncbi:DUF2029 domain-containing protein [Sphingomonas sp.]|uniref:DUF2029 domain-containing protein n=1 Tax=Sphingomonas sp. TaxID=28214 RepID=UPI002C2F7393|nr:DUF2029 domain-containing protein [Sphingomonas sp.]HWK36886.1 DUF2029 domain-containing protein [Sphingomonas sp.]